MQEDFPSLVFGLAGPLVDSFKASRPNIASAGSRLLAEISEFRGRVLYADGRRPNFQLNGQYHDEDPQDLESFHVTVRRQDTLIACLRVRRCEKKVLKPSRAGDTACPTLGTLDLHWWRRRLRLQLLIFSHLLTPHFHPETFIGRIVGREDLQALLRDMQLTGDECVEAGRWVVLPSARGSDLARTVLLSCWVIGRWLNKRRLFGLAGTRDGQAKMICRSGGQVVRGMESRLVRHLDDDLSLVYFDLDNPPQSVAKKLPLVERLLHLSRDAVAQPAY